MSNRGLAVLGLRLFALFLLYHSLTSLPALYSLFSGSDPQPAAPWYFYLAATASIGPAVLGMLIWVFVGRWVDIVLPQRTVVVAPLPMEMADWQAIAFAAVGMFVFMDGVPELLRTSLEAYEVHRRFESLRPEQSLDLGVAGLRVALGLGLLLTARRLSGFFMYLRRLGVNG